MVWNLSLLAPERVRAVAGLSVPFVPRAPAPPTEIMRRNIGEDFYIVWFQEPGVADRALAEDVRRTLTTPHQWTAQWAGDPDEQPRLPAWLSEQELASTSRRSSAPASPEGSTTTATSTATGSLRPRSRGATCRPRRCSSTGERDLVRLFAPGETMPDWVDDLRAKVVVPKAGHWVQQQAPEQVNAALLEFFAEV